MFDLTGRKALVTGASGGIVEEIARILHAQGATVGLHGTRVEKLEELGNALGERVHLFPANLADRAAVKALGEKSESELGGVDILVNNAGITKDGLFVRMSDEDWDAVLEVNLTSVFRLTRERVVLLLTDVDAEKASGIVHRLLGEFRENFPSANEPAVGLGFFEVAPGVVDLSVKNVLPNLFATPPKSH